MEEKRNFTQRIPTQKKHQITLVERERLTIDGVTNVESFDDRELVLETEQGILIVRGEELHIQELNLESSNLLVRGFVKVLEYTGDSMGKRTKGILAKLLK